MKNELYQAYREGVTGMPRDITRWKKSINAALEAKNTNRWLPWGRSDGSVYYCTLAF